MDALARRFHFRALILVAAWLGAGCESPSLWTSLAPWESGAGTGGACSGTWDCKDGLQCSCGTCQDHPPSTSCSPRPDAGYRACGDVVPACYRACGDLTTVDTAQCGTTGWSCERGVRLVDCPVGTCWGNARPGEVCSGGNWVCQYGSTPGGDCYTPEGCQPDGGIRVAPGCRHSSSCSGTAAQCQVTWCTVGVTTPAVCAGDAWACVAGVLAADCSALCTGSAPDCLTACGDPSVVASATCQAGTWNCAEGVRAEDCPGSTCWTPRPPGAAGCVDGGWHCGDAGNAPGGGCLTPEACTDAGVPPLCYAELCCTGQALPALCVGLAWSCGNQVSSETCLSQPACNYHLPDAGMTEPDAGTVDLDAGTVPDAGALCRDDAYEPNNTFEQATHFPGPASLGGNLPENGLTLCPGGDEDWYRFTLDNVASISVRARFQGGGLTLWLRDPNNQALVMGMDLADDAGVYVGVEQFPLLVSGDYGVVVLATDPAVTTFYNLSVEAP